MRAVWKSWITAMEMLTDRGYDVPQDHMMSCDDFISYYGDSDIPTYKDITCFIQHKSRDDTITLFWRDSIGTSDIQEIIEDLKSSNTNHALVVYTTKITPYASMALKPLKVQKIIIEVFSLKELQYNITRHKDVPKHIICSNVKKQEILEKYSVGPHQLPIIKLTDPVCRYYNASKGQLVKIIRRSESIPTVTLADGTVKELYDISYRIVS